MTRVIPFEVGHLDLMNIRDEFMGEFSGEKEIKNRLRGYSTSKSGLAATLVSGENVVLGMVGIVKIWEGVADIWAITSKEVVKHPIAFHKFSKRLLETTVIDMGLWRVQSTIKADWDLAIKWSERLGLQREATMKAFGPNKDDYHLYARVQWE